MEKQNLGRINLGECKLCGKNPTKKDHDACLGTLPGLMNACCGHGNIKESYIQFLDSSTIHGKDAKTILDILKWLRQ